MALWVILGRENPLKRPRILTQIIMSIAFCLKAYPKVAKRSVANLTPRVIKIKAYLTKPATVHPKSSSNMPVMQNCRRALKKLIIL